VHGDSLHDDEPMAQMNFIPLIDIALTLLIILMVTTVLIKSPGVQLRLPETVTREGTPETPKDLTIVVGKDGRLYIETQPVTEQQAAQRLRVVAGRDRNARVLVKGDRDVQYRRVMEVMDLARQAGLTRIILPTEPKLAAQR